MKKIRVNELARELEVKPGVILDMLPEIGVQDKKTHSSSLEDEVVSALRERLATSGIPEGGHARNGDSHAAEFDRDDETSHADQSEAEDEPRPPAPASRSVDSAPAAESSVPAPTAPAPAAAGIATRAPIAPPLRPPMRPDQRNFGRPGAIPIPASTPAMAAGSSRPVAAPTGTGTASSGSPLANLPVAPSSPAAKPPSTVAGPGAPEPVSPSAKAPSAPAPGAPATNSANAGASASATAPGVPIASARPATPVPSAPALPSSGANAPQAPGAPLSSEPERSPASASSRFQPLRPPLGGGGASFPGSPAGPATPIPPAASVPGNRNVVVPARPLAPTAARPAATAGPSAPVAGPRQPLPPDPVRSSTAAGTLPRPHTLPDRPAQSSAPAIPTPPRMPQMPPTHVVAPGPGSSSTTGVPGAPMPARPTAPTRPPGPSFAPGGITPGAPIAPRPPAQRATLAGQPAARPIVPPRPDLVQRLKQQQSQPPRPGIAASPAMPRPGAPAYPTSPAPGQPLYRGPIRPNQPMMRSPGGGPGMPPPPGLRRPGSRPMHPTTPLRPESATPVPTDNRRHQVKPGIRGGPRKRELEEGNLRERTSKRSVVAEPPPIDREITVAEGITVKELSEKLGVKANSVIKKLLDTKKIFASINQTLDVKLAESLAREFGASTNQVSYEEESTQEIELAEETKDLVKRAPVVTIMGHVDHGKTSLLDAIRQTNVAGREAGGITQHIGAYYIEKNDRKIVFIDTPGHQAFTRMRARGAKVTDIVILVVSADDGVMPQTLEAIDHAKAAKVPIIVAINKIDKPGAEPDRVKQQLADRGLLAEDWGGDTVMTPVSAKTGQNLDLLLEMILLVSDLQDFRANPARPALGTVLEAQLDRGRGPVATMLVRNGTLRVGEFFICGALFSKVRAMFDDRGNSVKEAEPSMPVEVIGLESLPEVGDSFQVVSDTSKAKQIVIYREAKAREAAMAKGARVATLDSLAQQFKEGDLKDLNLIIKADVGGTAEVLSDTLQQLSSDKIRVRVLHSGVGAITESDVLLASASEAIIVGFNVRPERNAQSTAEQQKVDIRLHSIIYELIDEIKQAMTGLLEPVFKETIVGHAEVRETFRISKVGTIAGCYVADGAIRRDSQIRVLRDGAVVHTGRIDALKRFKNDASEVKNGLECGISLLNFNNIQVGDSFEAFALERVAVEVPVAR